KEQKINRFSGSLEPNAVGRSFGGLSALPVTCPYRAEQATSLAGGHDYVFLHKIKSYIHDNYCKFKIHMVK
ncbi:MAG TPA: hypothetical protein VF941_24890, partial [Clostridia bacterium]